MPNYMVTGCAGFIGSSMTKLLISLGHNVVGVDSLNSAYDKSLKEWRLNQLIGCAGFEFIQMDLTDQTSTARLFDGFSGQCDGIVHLAAYAGVRYSVENPWIYYQTNVIGTLNLLDACLKNRINKFVLASSSSVYGNKSTGPFRENDNTDRVLSPYAASKKSAEELCFSYHHLHDMDITVLRFFTVYGPAGRPDMSPFRFVRWIYEGVPLTLYGDGTQERDFTYVQDVVEGIYAALKPLGYEVVNLGNDKPITIREFIGKIEKLVGKSAIIETKVAHSADVSKTWADIEKARVLLGWSPQYDINFGLEQIVEWYSDNRSFAKKLRL